MVGVEYWQNLFLVRIWTFISCSLDMHFNIPDPTEIIIFTCVKKNQVLELAVSDKFYS